MTWKSDEKLWEICLEIYRQMFKEAKPSADFDKLRELKVTEKKDWFMNYFLPIERQNEIIDEICKKQKVAGWKRKKIETEVHLGCSPNSSEETWQEHVEKRKLKEKAKLQNIFDGNTYVPLKEHKRALQEQIKEIEK